MFWQKTGIEITKNRQENKKDFELIFLLKLFIFESLIERK